MDDIKLYEISTILKNSLEMLEDVEDEEEKQQGIEDVKEQIKGLITSKSNNLLSQYRYFDNNINAIDTEIKRLQDLKKRQERQKESFISYVNYCFKDLGVDEVETPFGTIKYKKCPLSVEVKEGTEHDLPIDCVTQKITYTPDKKAIRELYKKGIILPNVIYHDSEEKLTFK